MGVRTFLDLDQGPESQMQDHSYRLNDYTYLAILIPGCNTYAIEMGSHKHLSRARSNKVGKNRKSIINARQMVIAVIRPISAFIL